jgi:chaperone required for assembly of F1-ATPase
MSLTPRRFYKKVEVRPADGGFGLALDGKPVKTPAGKVLVAPTEPLAKALAEEWDAQKEKINPQSMPLTRLLSTAIDRIAVERAAVVAAIAGYAGTDLLCYRAEAPPELVARQEAVWQPLLDWAKREVGQRLEVTRGVLPVSQQAAVLEAYREAVEALDDIELAAVALTAQTAGSLVIALALRASELDAERAFDAAELDATFQIERWGEDAEARDRRERLRADFRIAARLIELSRSAKSG